MGLLRHALDAADRLVALGISCGVISVPTIKPLDIAAIRRASGSTRAVFTIEEHSVVGGLGSAVAEALLEGDVRPAIFNRIGVPDRFIPAVGDQEFMRLASGLTESGIADTVAAALRRDPRLRTVLSV